MININIWCFEMSKKEYADSCLNRLISTYGVLKFFAITNLARRTYGININIWCFEITVYDCTDDVGKTININIWCFEIYLCLR